MTTTPRSAVADASTTPFWLDSPDAPPRNDPLDRDASCDLAVVGGGYTGLWTALLAKEAAPDRDVLLIEARTVGGAASGRNGGFCAASITHGIGNGLARFPGEMPVLERLGRANLDAVEATIARYGIDCGFERTGELDVATEPHQIPWLAEDVAQAQRLGHEARLLDRDAVRAELDSPTYLGGSWLRDSVALVDPARLAWGLKRACLGLGVRIAEGTRVTSIRRAGAGLWLAVPGGTVRARHGVLGTNAFRSPLRRMRPYIVPVYDYALVTEPLSRSQRDSVGWAHRQGVSDLGNRFHYYRLTRDNRILWGGYDAIYHFASRVDDALEQRPRTFELLAGHFFATFPQLAGLRFTHAWGGAIDTCTRFFAFQRTALGGRVAYSLGYTGLGVAASRFGAQVMLDLLSGRPSEATSLAAIRTRPVRFPPEPLRYTGIQLTRRALARADARNGERGAWLRVLDRLGMGFDS